MFAQLRKNLFQSTIQSFLNDRLNTRLEKLKSDDPKRRELVAQYQPTAWIADAARRVAQIQAVTHSLKATHPDARGTNLFCAPQTLHAHTEIGSHVLGEDFTGDVVGNAAALDVYKFLRLEVGSQTLLDAMLAQDTDLAAALSDDPQQAQEWIAAFISLMSPRGAVASDARAKQLYWLIGDDAKKDADYHLLAPLFATSLTHKIHVQISDDRFGEEAKEARQAHREERYHPSGYRVYPNLTVQNLGGTKPQNISQLNSERRGNNYLLASLPPLWQSTRGILPHPGQSSIFPLLRKAFYVWLPVQELSNFLKENPRPIMEVRDLRDVISNDIMSMLVGFSDYLQHRLPGWTQQKEGNDLDKNEQLWLDPYRCELDFSFREEWKRMNWPEKIAERFGNWVNDCLSKVKINGKSLQVGDTEQRHWAREFLRHDDWVFTLEEQKKWLDQLEKDKTKQGERHEALP